MRSKGHCSWVCLSVCLFVCLSVKPHLTSGASVHPKIDVMYSTGDKGEKFVGFSLQSLCCRDPALPALYGYLRSAIFIPLKMRMRIIRPYIVLSCLCVSLAARVASYRSYIIQSSSASDSSKDRVNTPPAKAAEHV